MLQDLFLSLEERHRPQGHNTRSSSHNHHHRDHDRDGAGDGSDYDSHVLVVPELRTVLNELGNSNATHPLTLLILVRDSHRRTD